MEEEEKRWQQLHYIPNWFSVDVKTGVCVKTCTIFYPSVITITDANDTTGGI